MNQLYEPPINPDEDTSPSITIRPPDFEQRLHQRQRPALWQRLLGWLSLLGAAVFTIGTVVVLLLPDASLPIGANQNADAVPAIETATDIPQIDEIDATTVAVLPTHSPQTAPTVASAAAESIPPPVNPDQLTNLLRAPVPVEPGTESTTLQYEPFTIVRGDRPRSDFIEYTAVQGDTIQEIALRYNLAAESIAWCNDRRIVQVLRPGDVLLIPPVDGACYRILGTKEETPAQIAEQFNVANAFQIIDSPYPFNLNGRDPDEILPGGLTVFVPEGEGEVITWNPGYDVETAEDGTVLRVSFAPGQGPSCGAVAPGGGSFWGNPLPNGSWVRGFYPGHTGLDLAAPRGTPIFAANSGPVLFAGFSPWGYGNTVVLAHGAFSTLYGHMSSINVGCGQNVVTGQVVGTVGSTGNSSGPHLHFEIRFNDTPTNPSGMPGIGW